MRHRLLGVATERYPRSFPPGGRSISVPGRGRFAPARLPGDQGPKPGRRRRARRGSSRKGAPGFGTVGDSVALTSKRTSITFKVTAKPGTTLHFVCAIHPWMQGTIKVT